MDIYRIVRSKSLYICFSILLISTVIVVGIMGLMTMPQGQAIALRIGMLRKEDLETAANILEGVDLLILFRQICLNGGMYNVTFGIWVMLFVCADFQGGFIKNIMALHQNRWCYVGSKVMVVAIVDFCYLVLHLLFTMGINWLFGNMVPYAKWENTVFYLTWVWLLTTAFATLVILICVSTRSIAAGSLSAVILGGGALVVPLRGILNLFHIGGWLDYTIYLTMAMGPEQYENIKDLYVYVVGIGFLVIYMVLTGIVLKKHDI